MAGVPQLKAATWWRSIATAAAVLLVAAVVALVAHHDTAPVRVLGESLEVTTSTTAPSTPVAGSTEPLTTAAPAPAPVVVAPTPAPTTAPGPPPARQSVPSTPARVAASPTEIATLQAEVEQAQADEATARTEITKAENNIAKLKTAGRSPNDISEATITLAYARAHLASATWREAAYRAELDYATLAASTTTNRNVEILDVRSDLALWTAEKMRAELDLRKAQAHLDAERQVGTATPEQFAAAEAAVGDAQARLNRSDAGLADAGARLARLGG